MKSAFSFAVQANLDAFITGNDRLVALTDLYPACVDDVLTLMTTGRAFDVCKDESRGPDAILLCSLPSLALVECLWRHDVSRVEIDALVETYAGLHPVFSPDFIPAVAYPPLVPNASRQGGRI